jgi:hypothetical protein
LKVPVVETNEFILYLEEDHGFTFIHCDVLVRWTREVKNNLTNKFKELTTLYGKPLYAIHSKEDKKHEKFLKMYGFSYQNTIKGLDNNDYDIYVWR